MIQVAVGRIFLFWVFVFVCVAVAPAVMAAEQDISIEEKVIMKTFVSFNGVEVYDRVCEESALEKADIKDKRKVNYMGNMQLLAGRLGGLIKMRNPQITVDEGVKRLLVIKKKVGEELGKRLKEKGCDSPEGKAAAAATALFTNVHPSEVYGLIDREIVKQGGTVTPPEEFKKLEVEPVKKK